MSTMPPKVINNIAEQIALGHTCYVHRYTAKISIIDDTIEDSKLLVRQDALQAELERKISEYVKLKEPGAEDQLMMMRDFLEDQADKSVRKQLLNALNRKNPIRNFQIVVDSDIPLQIHWSNFKVEKYREWVSDFIIDAYNY